MSILDKLNKISGKNADNIEDAIDNIEAGGGSGSGGGGDSFKIIDLEYYWDTTLNAIAYKINTPITEVRMAYDNGIPIFVKLTNGTLPSDMVEHVKYIYPAWFQLENNNIFVVFQSINLAGNADDYHVGMSEVSINIETFEYTKKVAY